MKTVEIKENDSNQRVDKFLMKTFKNLPESMMYKQIRKKNIKLNGKRCNPCDKLSSGDVLTLYVKDEFLEKVYDEYDLKRAPSKIDVVYEDENILIVNKSAGLIVHPDENYGTDSLISRVKHYLYKKGEYNPISENSFTPSLVNRIDRNTCGIVMAAKNADALRILNEKLKNREISKFYLCVVHGTFIKKKDTLIAYLEKDEGLKQVFISNKKGQRNKIIKTRYEVLKEKDNLSLLKVELLTGRTHQIRAHMAFIGHPLVGDGKYGRLKNDKSFKIKHQALCSYKLIFSFKSDAGILNYLKDKSFEIPLPQEKLFKEKFPLKPF